MQAQSINCFVLPYDGDMKAGRPSKSPRTDFAQRLNTLREAAGLTQQEVAAHLGITQPSYALWERHNVCLKPEQMTKLAEILGVRIEELLQQPSAARRRGGPVGKSRRLFEEISKLPRNQQEKVFDILQPFIAQHGNGQKQAA